MVRLKGEPGVYVLSYDERKEIPCCPDDISSGVSPFGDVAQNEVAAQLVKSAKIAVSSSAWYSRSKLWCGMTRRRLYRNIRKGGDSKQEPEKLAMVRKDVQLVKDAIQAMIRDGFLVSKNLSWFWFWLPLMWVVYPTPKLVQAIWDQQNSIKKATELVIKR